MLNLSSYTEYYTSLNTFSNYYTYSSRAGSVGSRTIDGFYFQTYPSGSVPNQYISLSARTMTKNDVGAIPIPTPYSGGTLRILGYKNGTGSVSNINMVFDRLVEFGGLSVSATTLQTVSTGTLPRFTGGTNVFCFLEPVSANTAGVEAVVTVTYTNQNGVSGRTGTCTIGGGNLGPIQSTRFVRLDIGDSGVRSVESIQLSTSIFTATTNSRINVVLAKFIGTFINTGMINNSTASFANLINGNMVGGFAEIDNNACLFTIRANFGIAGFSVGTTIGNYIIKETYEI